MWKLHSSLMMQPNWVNCELAMTSLRKERQQKCISLNWYDVCRRHLHSFPWQDEKAPTAQASESCSRCRSISCFCCSAKAAAEACCAFTWRWKRRRGKAQPSNNSSILFHGHIRDLAEILRNKMNRTVRRICLQRWHFMILVNSLWLWHSPNRSASYLNFRKLLLQHLHLMASACKTLQNMQVWNHHKSLLQQLGTSTDRLHKSKKEYTKNLGSFISNISMYLHDIPWHTRCFDRSKQKNWKAMRKPDLCVNIHSILWTDKSPHPVAEPVLLQPSIFLFPLFAPLHLVQFAAPAQPSQHGTRIAKKLCSAWDSHTLDQ